MSPKQKEKLHILLVGIEPYSIKIIKEQIEAQGDFVETAMNIDETIEKISEKMLDVIIVDWPRIQLASRLINNLQSKTNATPIILFTYSDEKELLEALRTGGTVGFVDKFGDPVNVFSSLQSCIKTITEGRRSVSCD